MSSEKPKKSLGQHWLNDERILKQIVQTAEVRPTDTVLEVGPGPGALTELLAINAQKVIAVEYDADLATKLEGRWGNVEVIEADILDFRLDKLEPGYKVVANIPYYLTSHLIRRLLETPNTPELIVLLIQKEVAERIVAEPGQMSILSVSAQHFADVSLGVEVAASYFVPPPRVDSQVVVLRPHQRPQIDEKKFFQIVKAGFSEKRKKLVNSLAGGLGIDKIEVATILSELDVETNARAQELTLEQWYRLYERMINHV